MSVKDNLKYTESHEWVRIEGNTAYVGISDHAQEAMGEIVFVEIPETGEEVNQGDEVTNIESVKSASAIYTPVTGTIKLVNETLEETPEIINEDPYGAFLFAVEMSTPSELDSLMDAAGYTSFLEKEA